MAGRGRERSRGTLIVILAITMIATFSLPGALAPPPGACEPWPSCKGGGGGGGDGGTEPSYRFTVTIQGEYIDVELGSQSFTVSIDTAIEITARFHVMVLPDVRITSIASTYMGPALIYTSPTTRAQVPNHHYETLNPDFGPGFVYSLTWESGSGNDFKTGKPLENLKLGKSTELLSFDIFVTERRPWITPDGVADYTLFLRWSGAISGVVTRVSETFWSFQIDIMSTGAVFQRLVWSDYPNRVKDLLATVVLNPTVAYSGSGTLTRSS